MTNGIIIDTSVWIDYFNNSNRNQTDIADDLLKNKAVTLLPVIFQEILQGIRDQKSFDLIKHLMLSLKFLEFNVIEMAINAASLDRFLKTKGITIRKPNDCLIAAICIQYNFSILHNDKDFDNIAKHTSLKIYKSNYGKNKSR